MTPRAVSPPSLCCRSAWSPASTTPTDRSRSPTPRGATYDARGKPLTLTGAEGLTTSRTYDAYGNLASLTLPGVPAIQRTASPLDRTLSYVNAFGETRSFSYDALGRVTASPYGR